MLSIGNDMHDSVYKSLKELRVMYSFLIGHVASLLKDLKVISDDKVTLVVLLF